MLVDLDFDHVVAAAAVTGPDVVLPEAHPVERNGGEPVAHLRELLPIREAAAHALDLAGAAADVVRRADVSGRVRLAHAHALARPEPSVGHGPPLRRSCARSRRR